MRVAVLRRGALHAVAAACSRLQPAAGLHAMSCNACRVFTRGFACDLANYCMRRWVLHASPKLCMHLPICMLADLSERRTLPGAQKGILGLVSLRMGGHCAYLRVYCYMYLCGSAECHMPQGHVPLGVNIGMDRVGARVSSGDARHPRRIPNCISCGVHLV